MCYFTQCQREKICLHIWAKGLAVSYKHCKLTTLNKLLVFSEYKVHTIVLLTYTITISRDSLFYLQGKELFKCELQTWVIN